MAIYGEPSSIAVYWDTLGVIAQGKDLLGSQFLKNACKIDSCFNSFIHLREKSEHSDQLEIFFPTSIIDIHLTRNASNAGVEITKIILVVSRTT